MYPPDLHVIHGCAMLNVDRLGHTRYRRLCAATGRYPTPGGYAALLADDIAGLPVTLLSDDPATIAAVAALTDLADGGAADLVPGLSPAAFGIIVPGWPHLWHADPPPGTAAATRRTRRRVTCSLPLFWTPDGDFTTVYAGLLWQRDNRDGTVTYLTVVAPTRLPGHDGRPWIADELWTATLPADTDAAHTILDKPHRITSILHPHTFIQRDDFGQTYDPTGWTRATLDGRTPLPDR